MKSVKCLHCGLVNWAEETWCKRCGNPPAASNQSGWSGGVEAQGAHGDEPLKKRRGLAVASMVVGIVCIFTFGLLGVGALAGLSLGIAALVKMRNHPAEYGGQNFAITGIVTSALSVLIVFPVAVISAIAIPNLLAARRAANEASAISNMRTLVSAEETFKATVGGEETYADLQQLVETNLISPALADGMNSGYRFRLLLNSDGNRYELTATPEAYGTSGRRSFYVSSEDSLICAADKHGLAADSEDPPLESPNMRYPPGYGHRPSRVRTPETVPEMFPADAVLAR